MTRPRPLQIVFAPDSFKECLDAPAVAAAMAAGWRQVAPEDTLLLKPLADGGEGTTSALVLSQGGHLYPCTVSDPLGRPVTAHFGLIDQGRTAVLEVAQASGLHLVPPAERDALRASSRGTGELMRAALASGADTLLIGLGGSATTDAGMGLLQALGARCLDAQGAPLPPGGGQLTRLAFLDLAPALALLQRVRLRAATDVSNPLLGSHGAAAVFAPQKGASQEAVHLLEAGLRQVAKIASAQGREIDTFAGAGAAGGIGAALGGLLGAEMVSGVETVIAAVHLEEAVRHADLVITGEGRLDAQSAAGKVPAGVCRLAHRHKVPVLALAGQVMEDIGPLLGRGLSAAMPISSDPLPRDEAFCLAAAHLAARTAAVARSCHEVGVAEAMARLREQRRSPR